MIIYIYIYVIDILHICTCVQYIGSGRAFAVLVLNKALNKVQVRDVGHWGSLPGTGWPGLCLDRGSPALRVQKDRRVRGAKYMPRPASMGRIPAVGSPEFCVDRTL